MAIIAGVFKLKIFLLSRFIRRLEKSDSHVIAMQIQASQRTLDSRLGVINNSRLAANKIWIYT